MERIKSNWPRLTDGNAWSRRTSSNLLTPACSLKLTASCLKQMSALHSLLDVACKPMAIPEIYTLPEEIEEAIGVTKWEPSLPAQLSGQAKGTFPAFLKKTDQERIQNMPWILDDDGEWEVTQKLDGSSCTVYWRDGEFGVCSRNQELKETEGNSFWHVANRYNMREMLHHLQMNIAIQGELMGPGVQGNSAGLSSHDFFLFDIWLIDESRHATPEERIDLFELMRGFGIKHTPILNIMDLGNFKSVDDILKYADERIDILNNSNQPEGVVFKHMDGSNTFKVISNKFLMGEK